MSDNTPELLPCPTCESEAEIIPQFMEGVEGWQETGNYAIVLHGKISGGCQSKELAIAAWNSRADLARAHPDPVGQPATVQLFFNPFDVIVSAYHDLYSNPCTVIFVEGLHEDDESPWGCTEFSDGLPTVSIDVACPISAAIEILAHELGHVAVGGECDDDHSSEWESAFSAIHQKYNEIVSAGVSATTVLAARAPAVGGEER